MENSEFEKRKEVTIEQSDLNQNLKHLFYNEIFQKIKVDVRNISDNGLGIKIYWPHNELNKKKITLFSEDDSLKVTGKVKYVKNEGKYSSIAGLELIQNKILTAYIDAIS